MDKSLCVCIIFKIIFKIISFDGSVSSELQGKVIC